MLLFIILDCQMIVRLKEMVLTVQERFGLLNSLGQEGGLAYLRAKRDIVSKVGLTADETVDYGVVEKDGKVGWDTELAQEKKISLSGGEAAIIVGALKLLEKHGKLHESQLTLYEKLVEGENNG